MSCTLILSLWVIVYYINLFQDKKIHGVGREMVWGGFPVIVGGRESGMVIMKTALYTYKKFQGMNILNIYTLNFRYSSIAIITTLNIERINDTGKIYVRN